MSLFNRPGRAPAALVAALLAMAPFAPKASPVSASVVPKLVWSDCDDGFQCATARVPLDYNRPHGKMRAYEDFPHFWTWSSYTNLVHAFWPVEDRGAFRGEIRNPSYATPALVIGMTHDPATPYAAAQALTADLGNARLLTFDADGHFAVGALDPCVLGHAIAYLEDQVLPPKGTVCVQQGEAFPASAKGSALRSLEGLHWSLPVSDLRSLPRR